MLGLWATEKFGETVVRPKIYAQALIKTDIGTTPAAAFEKLVLDLAGHGVACQADPRKARFAFRDQFKLTRA